MNYNLSFFDDAQRVKDVWQANFTTEHWANCWMWTAGRVWAQYSDWSVMELSCRRCRSGRVPCPRTPSPDADCRIARVPVKALRQASEGRHRSRPVILIVERDALTAILHEGMITAASCSVVSFADYAPAENWLSTHNPDAAMIEVRPGDKGCTELAKKLALRKIPFLAVSNYSAASPGINRIFQPVPWFEKPLTSAGLQLALRSIL